MRRTVGLLLFCAFSLGSGVLADGYSVRNAIVVLARAQLGKPYVSNAAGPNSFDCSGLVMYCYNQCGVSVGTHSVSGQWNMCDQFGSLSDLLPGDLVFYSGSQPSHVGIWTGSSVIAADVSPYNVCEHAWGWDSGFTQFGRIRASYWPGGDNSYNPIVAPGDPGMGGPGNGAWYSLGTDITFYAYNNGGTSPETRIWVDGGPDWGWGGYEGQHWGVPGSGTYTWHAQKRNAAGYSNVVTWSFHINYPPNTPSLVSPADGAILSSRNVPLAWNGTADPDGGPGAVRYCVNRSNWGGETGWTGTATSTSLTVPSDGTFTWQVKAADDWNASGYSGTRSFTVDTVAPSISATINPSSPNGSAGWYVTHPSISVGGTDATSGVAQLYYRFDGNSYAAYTSSVAVPEGVHTYNGKARDNAGNESVSASPTAKIDTTPPVPGVTLSPSAPNGENGWYTVNPTLTISAVDPNGSDGSCVQNRFYSIDGSEQPYTSEVTISDGGIHSVSGRATDVAGNSGQVALVVRVDTTAPVFASVDAAPESNSLDTLAVSWECDDLESGVAQYEYSIYRKTQGNDELISGPETTTQPYAFGPNLALIRGETYYFIIRAKNNAGLYSSLIASQDILATDGTRDAAPSLNIGGVSVPAEARISTNYMLVDSIGQFVVNASTSGGLVLESGYWHSEVTATPAETVAIAKATDNNRLIQLGSPTQPMVVTVAPGVFADRFYVEQPDRSSGIAASFGEGLGMSFSPGDRVWITGTLNTVNGERIIQGVAPTWLSRDLPLGALFVSNAWLGGSDINDLTKGIESAAGLNNIGLLVKTCGRVSKIDPSGAYFYINDGSGLSDGTMTDEEANTGVRVAADGRSYTER